MAPTDFTRNGQTVLSHAMANDPAIAFDGVLSKPRLSCVRGNGLAGACEVGIDLGAGNTLSWVGGRFYGPNNAPPQEHRTGTTLQSTIFVGNDPSGVGRTVLCQATGTQSPSFTLTFPNVTPIVARCIWLSTSEAPSNNDGTDYAQFIPVYDGEGGGNPLPPTTTPPPIVLPQGAPRDLGLHIGQSHMEAPGALADLSLYYGRAAIDNFTYNNQWEQAAGEPFNPNVSSDGLFGSGRLGPSLSCLNERALLVPGRRQGLILRPHGSTALNAWAPGGSFYSRTINDTLAAKASSPAGSKLAYVACWQGESGPSNWDQVFLQIVSDYRTQFNDPLLPFVFVVVDPRWSVAAIQKSMLLPLNVARVMLDDLNIPTQSDITDSFTHREIGRRLAWASLSMRRLP